MSFYFIVLLFMCFIGMFTYTLLEFFGLSYDSIKILEREQYWKRCFDTIKNGYNDN